MKTINVEASKNYSVYVGSGLLGCCGSFARDAKLFGKAVIISDSNVAPLYKDTVEKSLKDAGFEVISYVFKSGEASKNGATYLEIMNFLANSRITRTDTVFALGGGVTGDVAGFCAATYMRGINYVQLPTSLLAAVDSSVGGKTAIDLDAGKNLAGAFYQPRFVLCDTDCIKTLPDKYFSDGCAEIIKYAFICDKGLCDLIESGIKENLEEIISRCVSIKAKIVKEDEFEGGIRRILNFGHTVGHAAEALSDFKMGHGQAVAVGMYIVTNALEKEGAAQKGITGALLHLLDKYALPHSVPYAPKELFSKTSADKKCENGGIYIVTVQKIGDGRYEKIPMERLLDIIEKGSA